MARKNTRAASGAGSIRQRPDGLWEARFTFGNARRSIYGHSQSEVRKEMTAILRDIDKGTYQAPNKQKVKEWLNTWMETFCKNKVKPLTYSSYEGIIKNHIVPAIGIVQLQSLNGTHIQKLYNKMTDAGLSGFVNNGTISDLPHIME